MMTRREIGTSPNRPPRSSRNLPPPTANQLLAALPRDEYRRLVPLLDIVPLTLKDILHKPGEAIEHVYFPGGGFLSLLTVLEGGDMVEVATIGREGVAGVPAALNGDRPGGITFVQAESDTCYRMSSVDFRQQMQCRDAFHELVTRYVNALVGMIMQSTACNAVHSVEQRLARWLLMAQDRVGKNDFPLTQEFAAMMLGTTRPTVTLVAGTLQRAGLIEYHRGHLTILDRERLESASCECYRATTELLRAVHSR